MAPSFAAYFSLRGPFPCPLSPSGQVNPRGPELLGQLQDHDPRAVHRAWGAEGPDGAAQ